MPNIFRKTKDKSVKKLNGKTPQWFRDWHGEEFLEIKMRVTGMLWLLGLVALSAMATFGVILADYLQR